MLPCPQTLASGQHQDTGLHAIPCERYYRHNPAQLPGVAVLHLSQMRPSNTALPAIPLLYSHVTSSCCITPEHKKSKMKH